MYIFKLYWNKKKRWNMCATEICTQNVLVSNALSLRTVCVHSNIIRLSFFLAAFSERREWAMNDATVFCLVWTEVQTFRLVTFCTTTIQIPTQAHHDDGRKNECKEVRKRERNANSFVTLIWLLLLLLLLSFAHLHDLNCVTTARLYCVVFVRMFW